MHSILNSCQGKSLVLEMVGLTATVCMFSMGKREEPTIADHQEHEGLVAQQTQDGGCVGVLIRLHVPGLCLGLAGWDLRFVLKH